MALLGAASLSPLAAQPLLDQSYEVESLSIQAFITGGAIQMQTFTVGISGSLTEVDFFGRRSTTIADPTGNLSLEIRRTSLGIPIMSQAGLITSASVPLSNLPDRLSFFPLVLPNAPLVEMGQTLTIVLRSSGSTVFWFGDEIGTYDGGLYFSAPVSTGRPDPMGSMDLGFRTFVQPVPEPSSLWLTIAALSALTVQRRLRSTSSPR